MVSSKGAHDWKCKGSGNGIGIAIWRVATKEIWNIMSMIMFVHQEHEECQQKYESCWSWPPPQILNYEKKVVNKALTKRHGHCSLNCWKHQCMGSGIGSGVAIASMMNSGHKRDMKCDEDDHLFSPRAWKHKQKHSPTAKYDSCWWWPPTPTPNSETRIMIKTLTKRGGHYPLKLLGTNNKLKVLMIGGTLAVALALALP